MALNICSVELWVKFHCLTSSPVKAKKTKQVRPCKHYHKEDYMCQEYPQNDRAARGEPNNIRSHIKVQS